MDNIDPRYKIAKRCIHCQGLICYYDRRQIDSCAALRGTCAACKAKEEAKKKAAASFDMEKWKREYEAKNSKN